jgi:hypothetical protein
MLLQATNSRYYHYTAYTHTASDACTKQQCTLMNKRPLYTTCVLFTDEPYFTRSGILKLKPPLSLERNKIGPIATWLFLFLSYHRSTLWFTALNSETLCIILRLVSLECEWNTVSHINVGPKLRASENKVLKSMCRPKRQLQNRKVTQWEDWQMRLTVHVRGWRVGGGGVVGKPRGTNMCRWETVVLIFCVKCLTKVYTRESSIDIVLNSSQRSIPEKVVLIFCVKFLTKVYTRESSIDILC